MAIEKNVVAIKAVETAGKSDYPTVILHYKKEDGTPGKIGNFAAKLDADTRTKLKAVQEGTEVWIKIDKQEGSSYWNLIEAGEPRAVTAKAQTNSEHKKPYVKKEYSTEGRQTDAEKAAGQQRGNVLTNAVNLVCAAGIKDIDKA